MKTSKLKRVLALHHRTGKIGRRLALATTAAEALVRCAAPEWKGAMLAAVHALRAASAAVDAAMENLGGAAVALNMTEEV